MIKWTHNFSLVRDILLFLIEKKSSYFKKDIKSLRKKININILQFETEYNFKLKDYFYAVNTF